MRSELREHLKTLDPELATRAEMVWVSAKPIQSRASKPDGSDNGTIHCLQVEQNIWQLLSETNRLKELNAAEVFLLSCSACCHDLDRGLKSRIPEGVEHGVGSGGFVLDHHLELGILRPEAIAVDLVVSIHDKKGAECSELLADLPEAYALSSGTVNVRRLAALLKAADTLHTDYTRITELGTDPAQLTGMDRIKHLFRQCVSGWRCAGKRIVVDANPESSEQLEAVSKSESYMKDVEWSAIADALHRYGLPYELKFDNADHLLCRKAAAEAPFGLPGMDYYHEGDAALLAGRDSAIRSLEEQVLGSHASILIGPSGVGKSSVLHAGLVPRLSQLSGWGIITTRPSKTTGAFFTARDFAPILDGSITDGAVFADLCCRGMAKCPRLLVVLDQFEDIAYFGALDAEAIASSILDALAKHRHLRLLFSYRDDVESLMLPLWQAISHTAAGLPRFPLRQLGRSDAEASLRRLLSAKKLVLEDSDVFVKTLLDELSMATAREAGLAGEAIYPPFIQMVVQRLAELAEQGSVRRTKYESLAAAGYSPTDQVIMQFLSHSIKDLPKHGFAEEDGRRVLVTLAQSSGKKGVADEARIVAETEVPADRLPGLLAQMANMRLVRRLESGSWEIAHDLVAKNAISELISEEERHFKQARELLAARSRAVNLYQSSLSSQDIKDLWVKRELLVPAHLTPPDRSVILMSMATLEADAVADAAYNYGHDIEDVRGENTDPARWSAPGWYWLSQLNRADLLALARSAGRTSQMAGAVGYVRIASLVGSNEDIALLAALLKGPFSRFPKLAEDSTVTIALLAADANLPLLRSLAKDTHPSVRRAAAKALGHVGTRQDLALLGEMARDEYPHPGAGGDISVRDVVAEAVGKLGSREGLRILEGMVHDKVSDVLPAVAQAIARIGEAEGLPLLETIGKANYLPAKYVAAKAYAELSTKGSMALIRESMQSGNVLMQQGVAWVLKERGEPEDLPLLRTMMRSADGNVQYAAVAAIGRLGSVEDLPFLRKLATSAGGNWPIRRAAVRAIGSIGEHADFILLREIAKNDEVKHLVGQAAACLAWQLATREDVPLMAEVIRTGGSVNVLRAAVSAMARQSTTEDLLASMSSVILDSRPVVARMAAEISLPRVSVPQLEEFLRKNQLKLVPQALSVFDWYLFAPSFLKDAYKQWREKQNGIPVSCW